MAIRLAALLALAAAFPAAAQQDFGALAAKEIHAVVGFTPPDFAFGPGRDGGAPFAFYGDSMNDFKRVPCERSASFDVIAKANQAGLIRAGICVREAQRVRTLAASAKAALGGTLAMLGEGGPAVDAARLEKLGWTYSRASAPDGAEEHYYVLIAVGHGIAVIPTVVRVPAGAKRAVIVQADTMRLCENYGLKDKTPLCRDTRKALTEIARRIDARVVDGQR